MFGILIRIYSQAVLMRMHNICFLEKNVMYIVKIPGQSLLCSF